MIFKSNIKCEGFFRFFSHQNLIEFFKKTSKRIPIFGYKFPSWTQTFYQSLEWNCYRPGLQKLQLRVALALRCSIFLFRSTCVLKLSHVYAILNISTERKSYLILLKTSRCPTFIMPIFTFSNKKYSSKQLLYVLDLVFLFEIFYLGNSVILNCFDQ